MATLFLFGNTLFQRRLRLEFISPSFWVLTFPVNIRLCNKHSWCLWVKFLHIWAGIVFVRMRCSFLWSTVLMVPYQTWLSLVFQNPWSESTHTRSLLLWTYFMKRALFTGMLKVSLECWGNSFRGIRKEKIIGHVKLYLVHLYLITRSVYAWYFLYEGSLSSCEEYVNKTAL